MKKINLATNIFKRLVSIINEKREFLYIPNGLTVEELLSDDDLYSDWLNIHWNTIKGADMLVVRDFLTWSYLLDTEASSPVQLEYCFDEFE